MRLLLISIFLFFAACSETKEIQLSEISSPSKESSSLPYLYTDNSGKIFMSWVEENNNMAELKYATYDNSNWSEPSLISSDSTWFLNWADYPSIIGKNGKPLAAHWLNKKPGGTYAYDINISTFKGDWSPKLIPHQDETATEHGFLSMIPASDSTFLAIWLDGRETAGRDHHEYSDLSKAMTLRGAIIDTNGNILEKYLIDDSVCDCCNTSVTETDNGFIVAYRNRTDGEVRDIYTATFSDGVWSEPEALHNDEWKITACPVNGPSIDAANQTVATGWLTGAEGKAEVKLGISTDYGDTFQKIVLVDDKNPVGRVDTIVDEERIWLSWLSSVNETGQLNVAAYTLNGELINQYVIPNVSEKRSTGFPQITEAENGVVIAYTEVSEKSTRIRTFELN